MNIYDQHDKAFNNVSAYVITEGGERVATVAFKFPKDGAGRLWCYFHVIGAEMARGYAGGYGYDKKSAAVDSAIGNIKEAAAAYPDEKWSVMHAKALNEKIKRFADAMQGRDGYSWDHNLREAGFNILQAI